MIPLAPNQSPEFRLSWVLDRCMEEEDISSMPQTSHDPACDFTTRTATLRSFEEACKSIE